MKLFNESKTEEIPEFGDLMTVEDFKEACEDGGFIDDDGFGFYATEHEMYPNESVNPSDLINEEPKNFSHVVWFNK